MSPTVPSTPHKLCDLNITNSNCNKNQSNLRLSHPTITNCTFWTASLHIFELYRRNITNSKHHKQESKWVQIAKHLHISINTCYILTNSMIEISSTLNSTKIRATEFKRFIEISRTLNTAKIRATESKRVNFTSYVCRVAKTHKML